MHLRRAANLLRRYLEGVPVSFERCRIDWAGCTVFERKVLQALRRIPRGKTVTYGALARAAGCPKAARAVGGVMRRNRLPVILPCHRVVRACGVLGGYSRGTGWKRILLSIEGIPLSTFEDKAF